MPYLEALLMLSRILAEYNNVLVGIHPSFRHIPPIAFFSNRTALSPFAPALSAAV